MPERLTPDQRSRNMSRIRAKDTTVELSLRRALHARGLRFRKTANLPGRPDIVFLGKRVAIFVDGCFWHCCPDHYQKPLNNADYWTSKVQRNATRDAGADAALHALGWTVLRIWEHDVERNLAQVTARIEAVLQRSARLGH